MDEHVNDPDDPIVDEKDVPSFNRIEKQIRELDNTIIIYRIFYFFTSRFYRFQLIKKDNMCMIDLPRDMLEDLSRESSPSENELCRIITSNIENEDCWKEFHH